MLDTETKRRIDTARDILVGKLPDPKSQVEQITIALIYKFMDDMDAKSEELGGERTFFDGDFQKYGWARLMRGGLGGHEMLGLYSEAITRMPENPGIPPLFRDIFKNAYLPYRDPETLRAFLKVIDDFEYDHSERLGDAFEYLLSVLGSQGDAGQFRTPRHIIDFIVSIVDPKKDETVLDPACGTAGFLISAYKHILKANTDADGNTTLTPDDRERLAANFRGYDISPDMVRLSLVNMYLHGFADPQIHEYDTLTSLDRWKESADVILANPPFMSPKGGIQPHNRFSVQSKRSEVLFVDYIAEHLTPSGRAGIIVPEGVIFQSQTSYRNLRKLLVESYLVAVVSLPAGVFNPYSGVKTSILILDKVLASSARTIAFFNIESDGFGLGAQRRQVARNDLPAALAGIGQYLERLRSNEPLTGFEPELGRIVTKSEVAADGSYKLQGERLRRVDPRRSSWPTVELGTLFSFVSKGLRPASFARDRGPFPFFVSSFEVGRCDSADFDTEALVVGDGGSASIHYANGPFSASNHTYILEAKDRTAVLPRYVYWVIRENLSLLEEGFQGQGLKNVSKRHLTSIVIPLPPVAVQREIVNEINAYEKVLEGARAVVEHYRPRLHADLSWPNVPLSDVARVKNGFAFRSEEYVSDGLRIVRIKNVQRGVIVDHDPRFIAAGRAREFARYKLEAGDILMSLTGNVGRVGRLKPEHEPAVLNQRVAHIQVLPRSAALPDFLFATLNTEQFERDAIQAASGVAQANLSSKWVETYPIALPSLEEQRAIVVEIDAEQALVAANHELITRFNSKVRDTLARHMRKDASTPVAS